MVAALRNELLAMRDELRGELQNELGLKQEVEHLRLELETLRRKTLDRSGTSASTTSGGNGSDALEDGGGFVLDLDAAVGGVGGGVGGGGVLDADGGGEKYAEISSDSSDCESYADPDEQPLAPLHHQQQQDDGMGGENSAAVHVDGDGDVGGEGEGVQRRAAPTVPNSRRPGSIWRGLGGFEGPSVDGSTIELVARMYGKRRDAILEGQTPPSPPPSSPPSHPYVGG
jgi:hypothetical protein